MLEMQILTTISKIKGFYMEKKTDFKALSRKAKVQYIWDYYKWHILVAICVLALLIYTIVHFITYKESVLNVIMVDCYNNLENDTAGFDDFFQKEGFDSGKEQVTVTTSLTTMMDDIDATDLSDYDSLTLRLTAGGEDLILSKEDVYMQYAAQGCMTDLTELLPQDLLEQYKDQLIYVTDSETGASYPCGVCLTKDNAWLSQYDYYEDECYFGILTKAEHADTALAFLEYVLEQ